MKLKRERAIVRELRKDSRKRIAGIARETGIPRITINRWKRKQRAIIKFTAIVDFNRLGYSVKALYFAGPKSEELTCFIRKSNCVNNAYRTSGKYAYFLECIFPTIKQAAKFESELKNFCNSFRQHFIVREEKREGFLT